MLADASAIKNARKPSAALRPAVEIRSRVASASVTHAATKPPVAAQGSVTSSDSSDRGVD